MRGVAMSAVLAGMFLVVGCSGPMVVSPSPSPSVFGGGPAMGECVFEQGKSSEPCSKSLAERMAADEALYVEAEAVLRRIFTEEDRISRASSLITPELQSALTKEMALDLEDFFRSEKETGTRWVSGSTVLEYVRRAPLESRGQSVVALEYCMDYRAILIDHGDGQPIPGTKTRAVMYFEDVDGELRMADLQGRKGDEVC